MSASKKPGAPDAARGLVIVVAAALLGLFLLARGGSSSLLNTTDGPPNNASGPTTTVAGVPAIPKPTTTTPPPPANDPASVVVAVYNGTGGKDEGAAGRNRDKLTPLGFTQVSVNDTAATEKTVIYYAEGARGDAAKVAKALGFTDAPIEPTSKAASLPASAQGASVVVIVGQDAPPPPA